MQKSVIFYGLIIFLFSAFATSAAAQEKNVFSRSKTLAEAERAFAQFSV